MSLPSIFSYVIFRAALSSTKFIGEGATFPLVVGLFLAAICSEKSSGMFVRS